MYNVIIITELSNSNTQGLERLSKFASNKHNYHFQSHNGVQIFNCGGHGCVKMSFVVYINEDNLSVKHNDLYIKFFTRHFDGIGIKFVDNFD